MILCYVYLVQNNIFTFICCLLWGVSDKQQLKTTYYSVFGLAPFYIRSQDNVNKLKHLQSSDILNYVVDVYALMYGMDHYLPVIYIYAVSVRCSVYAYGCVCNQHF